MKNPKIVEIQPGSNRFEVVYIQQFGAVEPREYTETGYPKNTCTKYGEIEITFDPVGKTFGVKSIPCDPEDW